MSEPSAPVPVPSTQEAAIAAAILDLVEARGPASICPSEVARALNPAWQPLMGPVRRVAVQLAAAGRIDILRKGKPVPPGEVRGVIRLRLSPTGRDGNGLA